MATIQIMLRDTEDGLVDVETTILEGWKTGSNAIALTGRINEFLADVAKQQSPLAERKEAPKLEMVRA
jgi:hypothetical protein